MVPLRDQVLGGSRRVLFLLFASTGLVLLVACGNVANLLLARATMRQKEVAIRAALGASRIRILRQFLAESAVMALPAGAIGVGLAHPGLALLRPLIPAGVPFAQDATVDRTVLLFTFVFDVKPMTQLIAESLAPRRFSTLLLSAFAVVALVLSLAGIYAVIAHSVAQRTVEIGIRIAMGASPARVTGLMLRNGLLPVIGGMAVGWSGALAISRLFAAMLFDVGPLDLPTWILVSGSMLAVACLASYLPAHRACSVDPTVALRAE